MKNSRIMTALAASLLLSSVAFAAGPKTYQVTGPVLSVTDSMIVVQKGNEKWEIARDPNTKVTGDLKVGSKVTIQYSMTATQVDVKSDAKGAAKEKGKEAKESKSTKPSGTTPAKPTTSSAPAK